MKKLKLFIVYFPIILVGSQVLINLLNFITPQFYRDAGLYLNTFFGTNLLFACFLVVFTYVFKFCEISRIAAWAEVLFGINYLIVQQDNLYNILFQVIVGTLAIILTFRHYLNKFPLCRLSLLKAFIKSLIIKKCDCTKAIENWKEYVIKHHHATKH